MMWLWTLLACAGMNNARPLEAGEHAIGVTFGGPVLDFGGAPIPLPNLVVQGRHGLPRLADRPLDVHYGLDVTGIAFGIVVLHAGAAWQFVPQNGGIPALTVVNRLHLADNHLDLSKDAELRSTWMGDELELLASWKVDRVLLYGGVAQVFDFADPELLLSPIVGTEVGLGERQRTGLQVELRYQAINQFPSSSLVQFVTLGPGALQLTLGLRLSLGEGGR